MSISGRHHGGYDRDRHPDEDEGFDEHYFRRRPKSVCMSNDGRRFIPPTYGGLPPSAPSHLPPQALGIEQQQYTSSEEQHRPPMTMVSIKQVVTGRVYPKSGFTGLGRAV